MWLTRRASNLGRTSSLLSSYNLRVFLAFLLFYVLLVQYARRHSMRDPTSAFFDPPTGNAPGYSKLRQEEASAFIEQTNESTKAARTKSLNQPSMCVGIASVAREGTRYFKDAVGSLVDKLSDTEREDIYLILFLAHTNQSQHPAYSEPWFHELPDQMLSYDNETVDIDHIHGLETGTAKASGREKGLIDYTYLLKACESTNAPYTVMLEDDIVALDGWHQRTRRALELAERQTMEIGGTDWLYLRLFYTEEFLGWNSEEWPTYLFYSTLAVALTACIILIVRQRQPSTRPFLPNETILLLCGICTPLLIGLFFAAGRVTMRPIPAGVHNMPRFGCCSQGFVFPRGRIPDLVEWYESKRIGYVDSLTEEYADLHDEVRWAVTPSVLQHVGSKSTKADEYIRQENRRSALARIWNFGFEIHDAQALRLEHEEVKNGGTIDSLGFGFE